MGGRTLKEHGCCLEVRSGHGKQSVYALLLLLLLRGCGHDVVEVGQRVCPYFPRKPVRGPAVVFGKVCGEGDMSGTVLLVLWPRFDCSVSTV